MRKDMVPNHSIKKKASFFPERLSHKDLKIIEEMAQMLAKWSGDSKKVVWQVILSLWMRF